MKKILTSIYAAIASIVLFALPAYAQSSVLGAETSSSSNGGFNWGILALVIIIPLILLVLFLLLRRRSDDR